MMMIDTGQRVDLEVADSSEASTTYKGVVETVSEIGIKVKVDAMSVGSTELTTTGATYVFPWSAVLSVKLVNS